MQIICASHIYNYDAAECGGAVRIKKNKNGLDLCFYYLSSNLEDLNFGICINE